MTTYNHLLLISEPAGADLTGKKNTVVKMNTSGQVVPVTAITDIPLGILENEPDTIGKPASVLPMGCGGIAKIVLGATLTAGALAGMSTGGKALAVVSTNYTLGLLLSGGDVDDLGRILLTNYTAKA